VFVCLCAIPHTDGGVTDVDSIVGVGGLNVELQDVVDVGRVDVQGAQTLHHPRLAAQHLKHTAGDRACYPGLNTRRKESPQCEQEASKRRTKDLQETFKRRSPGAHAYQKRKICNRAYFE